LVRTISRSITRLSTAATPQQDSASLRQQQDQNHNISTAYMVVSPYTTPPHADQIDQQIPHNHLPDDDQSCTAPPSAERNLFPPRLELETSNPQSQPSIPSLKSSITDLLRNVADFSNTKTNHLSPARDNNLSSSTLEPSELPDTTTTTTSEKPSGPSSGRTAAERSCLGLVIGLVVAIVWL
jgi:hypothetical protein